MRRIFLIATVLAAGTLLINAQTGSETELNAQNEPARSGYTIETFSGGVTLTAPDGMVHSSASGALRKGLAVPPNARIATDDGAALELRMGQSVIKLAAATTLELGAGSNPYSCTLLAGRLRAVIAPEDTCVVYTDKSAAKFTNGDAVFQYSSGETDSIFVQSGQISVSRRLNDGSLVNDILIIGGQFADSFTGPVAAPYTPEQYSAAYAGLEVQPIIAREAPQEEQAEQNAALPVLKQKHKPVFHMGLIAGSMTIGDETWGKLVLMPQLRAGKLAVGFCLPLIFKDDLFAVDKWHKVYTNNEWSFGIEEWKKKNTKAALFDMAQDLLLKIDFLEYGIPKADPFSFRLGTIYDFTLGHGTLVSAYSSVETFPVMRKTGFRLASNLGIWGIEAMTNDVLANEFAAARTFFRFSKKYAMTIGLSCAVDIAVPPLHNALSAYGNPIFIGMGADMNFPLFKTEKNSAALFIEGSAMLPYLKNSFTDSDGRIAIAGIRPDLLYENKTLKNWLASLGVEGKFSALSWQLGYSVYSGFIAPRHFDGTYGKRKSALLEKTWAPYFTKEKSIADLKVFMGPHAQFDLSFLDDKLQFGVAYFWPWVMQPCRPPQFFSEEPDYIRASLTVKRNTIPKVNIHGSVGYERRGFMQSLALKRFSFFDEDTAFFAELAYGVPGTEQFDIAISVSSAVARDGDGSVIYRSDDPSRPRIVPTITLEARIKY